MPPNRPRGEQPQFSLREVAIQIGRRQCTQQRAAHRLVFNAVNLLGCSASVN
jgi:hypothetical protein